MDWSKTKTIFIIVFLILNVFLFTEFLKKWQSNQVGQWSELTTEERLQEENISFDSAPPETETNPYLNARVKEFSESEVSTLSNQTATIRNEVVLESSLNNFIEIEDPENPEELESYLEEFVIGGKEYVFWDYNEDEQRLIYHQKYDGMNLYYNLNGRLEVQLNENSEVISYKQTMLTSLEEFGVDQELTTPRQALEAIYRQGLIEQNSKVVNVELGYYVLTESTSNTQVLTPTWRMVIEQENGDQNQFYVNAVNRSIIEIDEESLDFELLEEKEEVVE